MGSQTIASPVPDEERGQQPFELTLVDGAQAEPVSDSSERPSVAYMLIFERLTGILGAVFLVAGLMVWAWKPHSQHRLALVMLVFAMFLSILHYYSLEEPRGRGTRA